MLSQAPDFSFLLMQTLENSGKGSVNWVTVTSWRDSNCIPGFWVVPSQFSLSHSQHLQKKSVDACSYCLFLHPSFCLSNEEF